MSEEPKLSESVAGWSYPVKSYKEGFQAGLKRGAAIAGAKSPDYSEHIAGWATAQARATAKGIQQAILKEMDGD